MIVRIWSRILVLLLSIWMIFVSNLSKMSVQILLYPTFPTFWGFVLLLSYFLGFVLLLRFFLLLSYFSIFFPYFLAIFLLLGFNFQTHSNFEHFPYILYSFIQLSTWLIRKVSLIYHIYHSFTPPPPLSDRGGGHFGSEKWRGFKFAGLKGPFGFWGVKFSSGVWISKKEKPSSRIG